MKTGRDLFSLVGRRIVVTGASSGIGRATAVLASQLGAEVVLTARREAELERTLAEMAKGLHRVVVGDLTEVAFVKELAKAARRPDGLVHAAGVSRRSPVGTLSPAFVDSLSGVNYQAFLSLMNVFVRPENRADRFAAVAVSSVAAAAGWPGGAAYCGTKGALNAAVRAMAVELAGKGIRVNAVCPGSVATPLFDAAAAMDPAAALRQVSEAQPLGLGAPEDIAAAACYLLSDAARFVTGVSLPVDGGYLAK